VGEKMLLPTMHKSNGGESDETNESTNNKIGLGGKECGLKSATSLMRDRYAQAKHPNESGN
jgi:hypothetical protein